MPPAPLSLTQLLEPRHHAGKAVLLTALSLAAALTEGLGLLLLVPMLNALGGPAPGGSGIAALLSALGMPPALGPLLALFVVLVVVRSAVLLARNEAALAFELAVVDNLRRRAWHALLHCDWRVLAQMRRSDSASLLITTVDRVGYGLNQLFAASASAITLAALGLAAMALSPKLAVGAMLGGAMVLFAYRGMRRRAAQLGQQLGTAYQAVHGSLGEGLAAMRVIKSLGGEQQAEDAALAGIAALRRAQRDYLHSLGRGQLALHGCGAMALAVLVWLAVTRWQLGATTILPLVALFARALPLLGGLQESWQHWSHARPALTAALALVQEAEAVREADGIALPAPTIVHELRLDAATVRFAADQPPALCEASLTIPARGMVALVGPSGAGKSTLADLASGLLSPDSGSVSIDGAVLDGGVRQAWRRRVAYVQQDPVLLAGTIRDNLLWAAPGASQQQIEAALHDAAASYVLALPEGLETRVGDGGRTLSGGERQRLMLARALLRDPALLVLDEATSALDAANEAAVAEAISVLKARMAILLIAHRGALTALADKVVTLEAGRIVAISG